MITYRTTNLTFFVCLFAMNMISLANHTFLLVVYIILFFIYLLVTIAYSFFIRSGFYLEAFCKKETNEKIIALTFDDGPNAENTPLILDILKGKAPATFFCIGRKIDGNEMILKRMVDEGHLIGTHSWSHSDWFDLFSPERMKREFFLTDQKITEITGKKPLLFRPPYGVINPLLKKALQSFNYNIIGFSNRSFDTSTKDEVKILERLTRDLRPGDVVLLHDSVPQCVPVLKEFLNIIEEKGFTVVPVTQLFNIEAYE
jgi:peptidoglycan-N-acetylglucosamine deacetylase